jgi:uncharacterized protein YbaP (TraB family)
MRAIFVTFLVFSALTARADQAMYAEQPGPRGVLYAVHSKKAGSPTVYLFGTIHVGKSSVTPFSHAVLAALATTKRLALEADVSKVMEAAVETARLGAYPAGDSLQKHISPKLMTQLQVVAKKEHITPQMYEHSKPWAVSALLEVMPAGRVGLDGNFAADSFLALWAKDHDVPIVELEGFRYQLELIAGTPDADQIELLDDEVKELTTKDAAQELKTMYDGWARGDEKAILTEIEKDEHKGGAAERFEKRLLDDRNIGMADKAEKMLTLQGDSFVAVGTAHLLGKKGLVAMLKQRGYDVTRIP